MRIKRTRRREVTVPVVSMADIAFLLLIFFMLTSTFMKDRGMQVLPEAQSAEPLPRKQINVSVTKDRHIFVDNVEVSLDRLPGILKQKLSETSLKEVTIRGDEEVTLGVIVKIMDIVNQSGGNIGIATR